MEEIGDAGVAVIAAAKLMRRNGDTHFHFRQESDFYYLTGFCEPDAILVLTPQRDEGEATIFLNPKNPEREQWDGKRLGVDAAPQILGVNQAFDIAEVDEHLPELLSGRRTVHALFGFDPQFDQRIFGWIGRLRSKRKRAPGDMKNLSQTLHELRVFKSDFEVQQMQQSADIAAAAHIKAMQRCKPGLGEWHLEAELLNEFMQQGARFPAYPCIVASGENACIMHYIENNAELLEGDLVLIDAGCELNHYASDITRTFPVGGTFSPRQRDIYEICLEAQLEAISVAKTGAEFNAMHNVARSKLTQGLIDLGIIQETLDTALEQGSDRKFLVHRCSHWLGLDVHDVGMYEENGQQRLLEPGMVLTIEPGIYIPSNESTEDVDSKWHGIGVRIEDDVLITEEGNRVLSRNVPKDIHDIETLMADAV